MVLDMVLDPAQLQDARAARDRLIRLQHEAELAQVDYQHAVRRLNAAGGSLREIADALGLSYQRVHQIVNVGAGKGAVKGALKQAVCSFCGTECTGVEPLRIMAGPRVMICESCVGLALQASTEGGQVTNEAVRLVSVDASQPKVRCGFCGRPRSKVSSLVEAPDRPPTSAVTRMLWARYGATRICRECLDLCAEILTHPA